MNDAAKRKSSLSAGLTVLRTFLLIIACSALNLSWAVPSTEAETRVWVFPAQLELASSQIAFATPSSVGENYDALAYDATGSLVAAKTTAAPRFLVTERGVAVPTEAAELQANMKLLQETSTSPATARKFLGTDSQGPLRVRIEQAHPSTPGYTGPIDPLHTVDHLHIDRRLNGTTGPWQSNEGSKEGSD